MNGRTRSPVRHSGIAGLVLACAGHLAATAASFPVDDSASQVLDQNVRMQWETAAPGVGSSPRVVGQATVIVRLDVSAWRGSAGRIFMTLPPRAEAPVEARWTTRGRLQPGSIRSGERAMVFAGPILLDLLEDTLVLRIATDGELLERDEALEFGFEIEVE
jgi:hypothetical protein